MQEMSRNQMREDRDARVAQIRREAQDCRAAAEAYDIAADEIYANEATSPIAGQARADIIRFARDRAQQARVLSVQRAEAATELLRVLL